MQLWHQKERQKRIDLLQEGAHQRRPPSPDDVAAFAYLHMLDEETQLPIVPADHHWLWLTLMCDPSIKRLLITAPPESAKTSWVQAYLACSIAFRPQRPYILAGATGPVATTRSLSLRTLVSSDEFLQTFPRIQRAMGMEWTDSKWSVATGGRPYPGRIHPTMSSYGTDGAITGSRAALLVGDDILEEKNTRTAYQREKVWKWVHNSMLSRVLARVGRVIVIGTSWHYDDPYAKMRKLPGWVWCNIPMLSEGEDVMATISYPTGHVGRKLGRPMGDNGDDAHI